MSNHSGDMASKMLVSSCKKKTIPVVHNRLNFRVQQLTNSPGQDCKYWVEHDESIVSIGETVVT